MDQLYDIQILIFKEIKQKIPANVSYVHAIAELLNVSYDSAYRRIRGEKVISLEELYTLSTTYKVSIDDVFNVKSGKLVFNNLAIDPEKLQTKEWLLRILQNIEALQGLKDAKIIYAAKDAPFFHYFQIPELAAFKLFFWEKTLFQFPGSLEKKFSLDNVDQELYDIGRKILIAYSKIPTVEIWNEDTFYIMLRQIEYYWISGFFADPNIVQILVEKLEIWIRHIEAQAEHGFQFMVDQEPNGVEGNYRLFMNEVVLSDNTVLVQSGDFKTVFLTYNVVNLLSATDSAFTGQIESFLTGLLKKSIQISAAAAKERRRFFSRLINHVVKFKSRIESDMAY